MPAVYTCAGTLINTDKLFREAEPRYLRGMNAQGIWRLIVSRDYAGLARALDSDPALVNLGLPADERNPALAHPLHRICDGVFNGLYTDQEGAEIARIFLSYGAGVNGYGLEVNRDTPLIAAASLRADAVALLYIDRGADIGHTGLFGATALHWAAWCGRDRIVSALLEKGAEVNKRCTEYRSTPLLWAVHGYKHSGADNIANQVGCARMLLKAGADESIPNLEGTLPVGLLGPEDREMMALFASAGE